MKEIEVKFKLTKDIKNLLKKIGAKRERIHLEENIIFDDKNRSLYKKKELLRLRKVGKEFLLTFKALKSTKNFKESEEIETRVNNFNFMKRILERLGFHPVNGYKKKREKWHYGNTEICIDKLSFGKFLEIEGNKKSIEKVIQLLNLDKNERITKTYLELYQDYCKAKGIKPKRYF